MLDRDRFWAFNGCADNTAGETPGPQERSWKDDAKAGPTGSAFRFLRRQGLHATRYAFSFALVTMKSEVG